MLNIRSLCVCRGNLTVVRDVSLHVGVGETVSLMGANGAGKTSLLRAVSGIGRILSGTVEFLGRDITHASADRIVEAGLIQIPEGRQLFPLMSVRENLEVAVSSKSAKAHAAENLEYVYSVFPELKEMSATASGNLSGGQQQMVAIARGLMADPKLLILDEPSIGLSPLMTKRVLDAVRRINEKGVSVLIAEQNIYDVLRIASRAYVLEQGRVCDEGSAEEILQSDRIRAAYLGI